MVGAWRGLIYELLSLGNWIAAFIVAQWLAPDAARHLPLAGASELLRYVVGFVLVFVAVLFVGGLVAFLVRKLVGVVGLRPVDRVLGAAFGVARGAVILMALTVVVGMTPVAKSPMWQESVGAGVTTVVVQTLKPVLPEEFGKYLL